MQWLLTAHVRRYHEHYRSSGHVWQRQPAGCEGIGELALVGVAPAIANAVFHATGKRVRELPITPEKLL
jgi:CO/xanthine dehydrogenase Mo-binding subunit